MKRPSISTTCSTTNARGTFFTVQKALPLMNDGGSIVLIGSGTWEKGIPNYVAYSATKAALRSYVRTWTSELKDRKIRANVISPGLIETPIIEAQMPSKEVADGARAYFTSITPLGRIGLPEEIAAAALFLASSESSYIAGINLPVDGWHRGRLVPASLQLCSERQRKIFAGRCPYRRSKALARTGFKELHR